MAKYRPVDIRLWSDRKFLALGDQGRLLWVFLMTTPSALPIPGVIVAGDAALAEQLGWSPERFTERFRELFDVGLSVRREGRVTWLPNALKYQPPHNPNAVKCWAGVWDDVPECSLKHDIWQALKIACKSWDRLFAKLFTEPLDICSPNRSGNGSTQKQDQKQEQKQDQDQDQNIGSAASPLDQLKAKADRSKANRKPSTQPLPTDWQPTQAHREKAADLGLNLTAEVESFRDHHSAKGTRFVDWDAAFRTWMRNAVKFGAANKPKKTPLEIQLDRVAQLEAEEARRSVS